MKLELEEIDLSLASKHECPGINTEDEFLALINGEYHVGKFNRQWYGWSFDGWKGNPYAGLQFDAPGSNSSRWQGLWRLFKNGTHISLVGDPISDEEEEE